MGWGHMQQTQWSQVGFSAVKEVKADTCSDWAAGKASLRRSIGSVGGPALTRLTGGLEGSHLLVRTFSCDPSPIFRGPLCLYHSPTLFLRLFEVTSSPSPGAPQPPPPARNRGYSGERSTVVFKLGFPGLEGSMAGPHTRWLRFLLFHALKFCQRFCLA